MADTLSSGPDGPRRRLVVALVLSVAALAAVTAVVAGRRSGPEPVPSRSVSAATPLVRACGGRVFSRVPAGRVAALLFDGLPEPTTLAREDRAAGRGPWTVVVRRTDGSLGRRGAVVTFPVPRPPVPGGWTVLSDPVTGRAVTGSVVWPLAGRYARIHGDLSRAQLVRLAARTSVVRGRPVVDVPAGYRVAGTGAQRPPVIREARYSSGELGAAAALGDGLTYTGVLRGGGFEDEVYARGTPSTTWVGGHRAVVTSMLGGNAVLAWEPGPGIVAYIGYSGATPDPVAVAALRELAGRACPVDVAQWEKTRPRAVVGVNTLG